MIRTESEQFLNVNSWCSWCSHMVYVDNGFVLIKDMKAVYQLLSLMNSKNKKNIKFTYDNKKRFIWCIRQLKISPYFKIYKVIYRVKKIYMRSLFVSLLFDTILIKYNMNIIVRWLLFNAQSQIKHYWLIHY